MALRAFATDPRAVARQYLWAGLVFLAVGGALAMLLRWQLAYPRQAIPWIGRLLFPGADGRIPPPTYTTLFTAHGLIMIFFAITPILIGAFGHLTVSEAAGGRLAFPRLGPASFWTLVVAQIVMLWALLADIGPGAGWTMYTPLSLRTGMPGGGQTWVIVAIFVASASTMMSAVNYLATLVGVLRGSGALDPASSRTADPPPAVVGVGGIAQLPNRATFPLAVWGQFFTAILNVLFVPVLGAAAILMFSDRVFGTQFFTIQGDPILYQHLFWIFGHPEVYVLILPAWGITADLLAHFAGRPPFWRRGTIGAMIAVTALSGLVYGHHLFVTGLGPLPRVGFEALTMAIGVPSTIIFVNWLMTVWRARPRFAVPALFALGVVVVFGLGGLTGLFLGTAVTDVQLHDTMFVVGHFHLTMAAATFLAAFGAIYHWFPLLFGRELDKRLGVAHVALSLPLLVIVFGSLMVAGWNGQLRRLYDPTSYEFLAHLAPLGRWTSWAAFALGAAQLLFVVNFFVTLARRRS